MMIKQPMLHRAWPSAVCNRPLKLHQQMFYYVFTSHNWLWISCPTNGDAAAVYILSPLFVICLPPCDLQLPGDDSVARLKLRGENQTTKWRREGKTRVETRPQRSCSRFASRESRPQRGLQPTAACTGHTHLKSPADTGAQVGRWRSSLMIM